MLNKNTPYPILSQLWNTALEEKGYSKIITIFRTNEGHPLILAKAYLFVSNSKNLMPIEKWGRKPPGKKEYVKVLKPHYPEVTTDMPLEWLKKLLFYQIDVEELTEYDKLNN